MLDCIRRSEKVAKEILAHAKENTERLKKVIHDFKTINETKGHAFGDSILIKIGNALTECFKGCHVYRYGNDEFHVVGENTPDKDFIADCKAAKKTLEESDISFSAGYVYGVFRKPFQ